MSSFTTVLSTFFLVFFLIFVVGIITAIPLYFLWNYLAPIYFSFLPPVWIAIPFWNFLCLTWCLGMIRSIIMPSATATATAK